ncbi:hypothetical protein A3B57_00830 [Microgenomates group bacterium RIFCSPLOWO2_01_FULL_47_10]|nr:MAG: hypothetical protein A3B57_00830 [Microgenomates group bacterium RIFCSPLOWO2_01_FULL_47_10]
MSKIKPPTRPDLSLAVIKQMLSLTTAGFGLVAALAWNEVIKEVIAVYIKPYVPAGSGVVSLLFYALIVTVLAVSITLQLTKLQNILEKKSHPKR